MPSPAELGRTAYANRAWEDAFRALSKAKGLSAEDTQRLAWAAALTSRDAECVDALERTHQLHLDANNPLAAARAAFWAGFRLMSLGETARGSGWLSRAARLLENQPDCAEHGYLKLAHVTRAIAARDHEAAIAAARAAASTGDRFKDADLVAFARNLEGRALIRAGKPAEGLPLLDEVMLAATSGSLSPVVTGILYCSVIASCQQSYALDRAREWTSALSTWCQAQPQLVNFAGTCLIHRSEILQLSGDWPEAIEEIRRASERLADKHADTGYAHYQAGELHRVRGELEDAEQAFARASEHGRDPQPGLALLRLAQGKTDAAANASRRVLAATTDPLARCRVLPAHVEIMLAANDLAEARTASDELSKLAATFGMDILTAIANATHGAVLLADGDAKNAVAPLQQAHEVWQRVSAPYLAARVRVLMARAFRALGDADSAALALDAARKTFTALGAHPDLGGLDAQAAVPRRADTRGLSPRELEVLRLVAAGKTNKAIGQQLFVSEKTVDRHVSNIFAKLDVATRSAATAWAFQNGLVG